MRALIISDDGFEDSELRVPRQQLEESGIAVDIAALHRGKIRGKRGLRAEAELSVGEAVVSAYDLLILPGGTAPAKLRRDHTVLDVVREFIEQAKPIAAICHGPQILVSAGVLSGRTATGYQSIASEMRQAGVHYVSQEVVVDGDIITSRKPADLPAFMNAIREKIGVASN